MEISHRAAGTNLLQMVLSIGLEGDFDDINGVSWLPLYHDMGLMMIGFPILYGGHLTFMSPMAFVRRPLRWIQVLSNESQTCHIVSPAPNFAFDLVAQRGMPANAIDLSECAHQRLGTGEPRLDREVHRGVPAVRPDQDRRPAVLRDG